MHGIDFTVKLDHLRDITERARQTRQQMAEAGWDALDSVETAEEAFNAMTEERPGWGSATFVRAFADTPYDQGYDTPQFTTAEWAKQVRDTFVNAFLSPE